MKYIIYDANDDEILDEIDGTDEINTCKKALEDYLKWRAPYGLDTMEEIKHGELVARVEDAETGESKIFEVGVRFVFDVEECRPAPLPERND